MAGTAVVQMNTRIGEELKRAGDEVLAGMGFSPSAAVRGLWRFVVKHRDDRRAISSVLEEDAPAIDEEVERKLNALKSIQDLYQKTVLELGISTCGATDSELSYKELRDQWYEERLDREYS